MLQVYLALASLMVVALLVTKPSPQLVKVTQLVSQTPN